MGFDVEVEKALLFHDSPNCPVSAQWPCCPIVEQILHEVAAKPERVPDNARQAREAQPPLREVGHEAQQQVGELSVQERDDVAEGAEPARVQPMLICRALDQPGRNPLDNLPQDGVLCLRWPRKGAPLRDGALAAFFVFHTACRLQADGIRGQLFFSDPCRKAQTMGR